MLKRKSDKKKKIRKMALAEEIESIAIRRGLKPRYGSYKR